MWHGCLGVFTRPLTDSDSAHGGWVLESSSTDVDHMLSLTAGSFPATQRQGRNLDQRATGT
jgi:hypothetical protein